MVSRPVSLYLDHNQISDSSHLGVLPGTGAFRYRTLSLYGNSVSDLTPLLQLPRDPAWGDNPRQINVARNMVADVSGLVSSVDDWLLDGTRITDMSML